MNLKKVLTSLAVTVMLTDVLLLALAFAPATVTNGSSNHEAQSAMVQESATPQVLIAGNTPTNGSSVVWPAWLKNFRKWLRNCWDGLHGDAVARERCVTFRSQR